MIMARLARCPSAFLPGNDPRRCGGWGVALCYRTVTFDENAARGAKLREWRNFTFVVAKRSARTVQRM
jgi:hypothetical protein